MLLFFGSHFRFFVLLRHLSACDKHVRYGFSFTWICFLSVASLPPWVFIRIYTAILVTGSKHTPVAKQTEMHHRSQASHS